METGVSRWYVVVLVVTVLLKGLYTAFAHAVLTTNDSKLKIQAESAFSVARAFSISVVVVCGVRSGLYRLWVYGVVCSILGNVAYLTEGVATLVYVVLLVAVVDILTEVVPRRFAEKHLEALAVVGVPYVKVLVAVFKPLTLLIDGISYVLCRLLGLGTNHQQDTVTEEEILMMVEAGNETGVIEESQKDMINNIFDFEDVTICDVMTHRKDIIAIDVKSKISDVVYIAINEGFSRIPVYQSSIDNIIGVIYVKDLLSLVGCKDSERFNVCQYIRKVMYVHEYCKCSELFESMTIKKLQMAIVVDEYGGTAGLITLEDLIEEIVGNIQDEYDQESVEIEEISEGVYTIDGSTDIEDVCQALGITLPSEHNYDTMSAFIVDLLGHIPDEDEVASVEYQGIEFTVLLVEDNWISKVKAVTKVKS